MQEEVCRIEITRAIDNTIVTAKLVKLTRSLAQREIDAKWWVLPPGSKSKRELEGDHSWKWSKIIGELRNNRWCEAFAVQTDDDEIQGSILYRLNTTSFVNKTEGAIYVQGLATAPRNRPWLVASPAYRGVGEELLLKAVRHSYSIGFQGRVNLIAFDEPKTINFYQKRGFSIVRHDEELPQLELEPGAATAWLRREGYDL
jgi:GNAT superfamily N-acetyltransferase